MFSLSLILANENDKTFKALLLIFLDSDILTFGNHRWLFFPYFSSIYAIIEINAFSSKSIKHRLETGYQTFKLRHETKYHYVRDGSNPDNFMRVYHKAN